MKTSFTQFQAMVEFMERNGDLSKPSGGPRGRHWCNSKWKELTAKLNSDGSGESKTEDKWRKVWSDLKNNTKKKAAKINRSMNKTGGGPALKMSLTDLEARVMAILGDQAATGMVQIQEVGFEQETNSTDADDNLATTNSLHMQSRNVICIGDESWNTPHASHEPTTTKPSEEILSTIGETSQESIQIELTNESFVQAPEILEGNDENWGAQPQEGQELRNLNLDFYGQEVPIMTPKWKPPKKKSKKTIIPKSESAAKAFLDNERHKDKIFYELEKEKIRQRDVELSLQRDWLQFMREALETLRKLLEKQPQE